MLPTHALTGRSEANGRHKGPHVAQRQPKVAGGAAPDGPVHLGAGLPAHWELDAAIAHELRLLRPRWPLHAAQA